MNRSVSSLKIYRISASLASRKEDSLLYENGTVNFVLAINSEGERSFRQLHRLLKIHVYECKQINNNDPQNNLKQLLKPLS